jgi:fumarate reductase flavoprotein subunit
MEHPARMIRAAAMPAGTPEVAVAIVGAGACGLTAAVMLAEAGVDCVLLERDATPQGSTALSSGFIPAAGTRVQRAAGVQGDSAERFAADIQRKAHATAWPSNCSTAPSTPATRCAACTRCRSAPARRSWAHWPARPTRWARCW